MTKRGATYLEVMVVSALVAILAGAIVVPAYQSYRAARAPADATATLAQDIALLERAAQNGTLGQGACLLIVSADPLVYQGYRGRPASIDPDSTLGELLFERRDTDVALTGGPIGVSTPLLFATDGKAQYVASGLLSDPHATIELTMTQRPRGRAAFLKLSLFTGSVWAGSL